MSILPDRVTVRTPLTPPTQVEFKMIEVLAEGPDGTRAPGKVSVLDCDTITQIKGKLYRAIYPHQPFSQQPLLDALSLLWTPASGQGESNCGLIVTFYLELN